MPDFAPAPCATLEADRPNTHPCADRDAPAELPPLRLGAAAGTVGLALLGFALVLWDALLFLALAVGLPQNDFCRMYYSGVLYWQGEDMYGWNPATPAKLDAYEKIQLWNMNPPHFHLIVLPLALLPRDLALAGWWGVNFVCLAYCLRLILRETGLQLTPRARALVVLALLGFTGTGAMILTSQLSLLLLVPLTWLWIDARNGRWFRAGLWLGVCLSVKPFLLLLVPYLLLKRRWSGLLATALGTAGCFALGLLVFGVESHRSWRAALGVADSWAWLPMNASVTGFFSRCFSETTYFEPLWPVPAEGIRLATLAVSAGLALLTLIVPARDNSPEAVDRSLALLLTASVLLCPLGWTYYFWLPLGPAAALVLAWRRRPATGMTLWGRRLFWIAFVGLFWPIQLTGLFQPAPLPTLLIASAFFWTLLGLWLGLLLDGWGVARRPNAV